jgi:uncharacterized membrane protein YfcA
VHDTPTALATIAGAFLLAGTEKGEIGMGLPTVAMGVLGLVMPSVQTLGLSFTTSTVALAAGLAATGQFPAAVATTSALALIPAFVGMFLGQAIRTRVHPDVFRRWFFAWLLLMGLYLFGRAVAALTL